MATTSRPFLRRAFSNRRDFVFEHSDVAGDRGILLRADKTRPTCSTPCGIDRRTVVFHGNVVTSRSAILLEITDGSLTTLP